MTETLAVLVLTGDRPSVGSTAQADVGQLAPGGDLVPDPLRPLALRDHGHVNGLEAWGGAIAPDGIPPVVPGDQTPGLDLVVDGDVVGDVLGGVVADEQFVRADAGAGYGHVCS